MHELLLRSGYEVEVHPIVTSTTKRRPDFAGRAKDVLFLEATLATDESNEEKGRNRVLAVLYDQINQMELLDYFLDINRVHNPTGKQPSGKKLRDFISRSVQGLNYDALLVASQLGCIDQLPSWTYREGELEIDLSVIPASKENRGEGKHSPMGIHSGGSRWGGGDTAIREAILKKAGKYGRLDAPYIVAVNCLSPFGTTRRDDLKALFGTDEPYFQESEDEPKLDGIVDGAWYHADAPQYRRISAVLLARVYPWNLPIADVTLYHNPWAYHSYHGQLTELPQVKLSKSRLHFIPGKLFGGCFSLPDDWPGQLFDV